MPVFNDNIYIKILCRAEYPNSVKTDSKDTYMEWLIIISLKSVSACKLIFKTVFRLNTTSKNINNNNTQKQYIFNIRVYTYWQNIEFHFRFLLKFCAYIYIYIQVYCHKTNVCVSLFILYCLLFVGQCFVQHDMWIILNCKRR